jgi:hypothetical protein
MAVFPEVTVLLLVPRYRVNGGTVSSYLSTLRSSVEGKLQCWLRLILWLLMTLTA